MHAAVGQLQPELPALTGPRRIGLPDVAVAVRRRVVLHRAATWGGVVTVWLTGALLSQTTATDEGGPCASTSSPWNPSRLTFAGSLRRTEQPAVAAAPNSAGPDSEVGAALLARGTR